MAQPLPLLLTDEVIAADRAYLQHHFSCAACCASAKSPSPRCQQGADLYQQYEQAYFTAWHAIDPLAPTTPQTERTEA